MENILDTREQLCKELGVELFVYLKFPNSKEYCYVITNEKMFTRTGYNSFKEAFEAGIETLKLLKNGNN